MEKSRKKKALSMIMAIVMVLSMIVGLVPEKAYAASNDPVTVNAQTIRNNATTFHDAFPNVFKYAQGSGQLGMAFIYNNVAYNLAQTETHSGRTHEASWYMYSVSANYSNVAEVFDVGGDIAYCFDMRTPAGRGTHYRSDTLEEAGIEVADEDLIMDVAKVAYVLTKDNYAAIAEHAEEIAKGFSNIQGYSINKDDVVAMLQSTNDVAIKFKRHLVQWLVWSKCNDFTFQDGAAGQWVSGGVDKEGNPLPDVWIPPYYGVSSVIDFPELYSWGLELWTELEASANWSWEYEYVIQPGQTITLTGIEGERIWALYQQDGYFGDSSLVIARSGETTTITAPADASGTYDWQNINPLTSNILSSKPYQEGTAAQFIVSIASYIKGRAKIRVVPLGNMQITKTSTNTAITNGNSCYSFEGAVFGVYASQSEAAAATNANRGNPIAVLTTGADGKTPVSDDLASGTYYVKELVAPAGYRLSDDVKSVVVEPDLTTPVTFSDEPVNDPGRLYIYKKSTSKDARIEDQTATFKVEFFANDSWSGNATRTWYFKTINGIANIGNESYFDTSYTNPELYKEEGVSTYPLGTIRVTEVKAPNGYIGLGDNFELKGIISEDSSSPVGAAFEWISPSQTGKLTYESDGSANIYNEQFYGGVKFSKVDNGTLTGTPSGNSSLAGAEITIYNNSGKTIILKDGTEVADGAAVLTITTDARGAATTADDALPYGTYYAVETKAPTGYLINSAWKPTFNITEAGVIVDATATQLQDTPTAGAGAVVKADAQNTTAQGDASLEGIKYAIVNNSTNPISIGKMSVAKGQVAAVITTDATGKAATGAKALPYGSYIVYELRADATITVGDTYSGSNKLGSSALANGSYLWKDASQSFTITTDGETQTVNFTNSPLLGGVKIEKWDAELNRKLAQGDADFAGIKFEITNKSAALVYVNGTKYEVDAVVATITTDAAGNAQLSAVLPYGTYEIKEVETNST